jgi:hypothetical protein
MFKQSNSNNNMEITLDEPVVLFGKSSVEKIGIKDGEIKLKNNTDKNATVEIVVGYDAVS